MSQALLYLFTITSHQFYEFVSLQGQLELEGVDKKDNVLRLSLTSLEDEDV